MEPADFSLDLFSLRGRTALVTGGNTGLGQACTLALATAGADVAVVTVAEDGGETRRQVEARGRRYAERGLDLTRAEAPRQAVDWCTAAIGPVDVLVNCAGVNPLSAVDDFGRDLWDPSVAVNLTAAFELSHEAARGMLARASGGAIINIASVYSFRGGRRSPAYAATKHGLVGLTRAYCDELAARGVRVNAIAPGYMATDLTRHAREDPELSRAVLDHVPAGRWGEPADVMGAVVFLASPASAYVHGHVLSVDGGYLVR